jgi:putative holliday junction resolvase
MTKKYSVLGLDVGEKRIGVAIGDSAVKIAVPYDTLDVDGTEIEAIAEIIVRQNVDIVVVGYPRNQSGEATKQSEITEIFAKKLQDIAPQIVFQDESLTSVMAEQQLQSFKKPYSKGDIDARAASLILQDFIESRYGR